jgi:hypothetical protein
MALRVAQLLNGNDDIPGHIHAALTEGRMEDAGTMLMDAFELTCDEASDLVDRDLCCG